MVAAAALAVASAAAIAAERPPVFPALDAGFETLDAGRLLLAELNCVACHQAGPGFPGSSPLRPAPDLAGAAARLKSAHLEAWIENPARTKPGTVMPGLLEGLPPAERAAAATDLGHFVLSLGAAPAATSAVPSAASLPALQGRVLYHQVGCVACHAPFEPAAAVFPGSRGAPTDPDAVRYALSVLQGNSQPLPDLAAKYRPGALAVFLENPLAARPGGRMPSMNLTGSEARAIATYLTHVTAADAASLVDRPFVPDPARVRRGRNRFSELGCAACHSVRVSDTPLLSRRSAKRLEELDPAAPGCLSGGPGRHPRYVLSSEQRQALESLLRNQAPLRQPVSSPERLMHTLAALHCTACHSRDGLGGPTPGRWDYFRTLSDADLGDEGRIPPHLTGVGAKLRPAWLGEVLTNRGAVRPYLGVRMPQYGSAQGASLQALLPEVDRPAGRPEPAPAGDVAAGRALAGVGGYVCINCHSFGPHPSLGLSVMDMTRMAGRLEWDWFRRYLLDPPSLRPGTRMPSFWPEGEASIRTVLGGDVDAQVAALWAYLLQGMDAAPPPGLLDDRPSGQPVGPVPDYE